jgi:hypothetical protein
MPSPTDAWQTTLEAAIANSLATTTVMVAQLNEQAKTNYLNNTFKSWETMVIAGKIDNKNPPKPPVGYAVVKAASGFYYPEPAIAAVCEMPPLPKDYSKTQDELDKLAGEFHMEIGVPLGGNYWSAGQGDTCPGGFRTPPLPEGPTWPAGSVFQKIPHFMGKGWWLKVA